MYNYEKDVKFEEPLDIKYEEFWPSETDNLHLKKIECNDVRLYWSSKSAAYIPDSVMQDTKESRDKIFEAINADTIHNLMTSWFIKSDNEFKRYSYQGVA